MIRPPKLAVTLLAGVVLAAALSACGANPNAEQAPADTETAEPATRVFRDYAGHEVTIPAHPQRILVDQFMGHLLALGIKPLGATTNQLNQFEQSSFLQPLGLTDGVEDLGGTISAEKALGLNPDLIIVQQNEAQNEQNYETYAKIAPTIVLSYGSQTMPDQLREIADVVGEQEKAERWIAQYEEKAANYRAQLADVVGPDVTFTVMEMWPKAEIMIFGNRFGRGTFSLYNSLQLKAPPKVEEAVMDKQPSYLKVSLETLPDYIGEYVFLTVYDWQDGDNAKLEAELKEAPVWRSLPVVKQNRVFQVDVGDFLPGDPISIEKQMETQAELLLEHFRQSSR